MKQSEIESKARSLARKRLIFHWLRIGYTKEEAQKLARELIPYAKKKKIKKEKVSIIDENGNVPNDSSWGAYLNE